MGSAAFMLVIEVVDTVAAKLANRPIPGVHSFVEVGMVFVVFLPLAYVQVTKRQLAMDLLTKRVPRGMQTASEILTLGIGLFFFILLAWNGAIFAWDSWEVREFYAGQVTFPVYPAKFALLLGTIAISLKLFTSMILLLATLRHPTGPALRRN